MSEFTAVDRQKFDGISIDFFDAPFAETETGDQFVSVAQAVGRISVPEGALDTVFKAVPPVSSGFTRKNTFQKTNNPLPKDVKATLHRYRYAIADAVESDLSRYMPECIVGNSHVTTDYSSGDGYRQPGTAAQWHLDKPSRPQWQYTVSLGANSDFSTEFLTGAYDVSKARAIYPDLASLPKTLLHTRFPAGTLIRFLADRTFHRAPRDAKGHRVFFLADVVDSHDDLRSRVLT